MTQKYYSSYTPYQMYESDKPMNLKIMVMRYVRNWPWFILSICIAVAAAYVYSLYQKPIYRVQTSLLIKDDKKGLSEENILKEMDIFTPKKVIENETEILRSFPLMQHVVTELGIDVRYFYPSSFINEEIYSESPIRLVVEKPNPSLYKNELSLTVVNRNTVRINDVTYPVNKSVDTPYGKLKVVGQRSLTPSTKPLLIQVSPRDVVIESYLTRLTVEPSSKASTVLQLSLEDAVPERGEAILTKLIESYNQAAISDKNIVAANTLKFIEDRLLLLSGELSTVEKGVESFKSTQGITDLSSQASLFLQTVKENDDQLNQNAIQLGIVNDLETYIARKAGERGMAPAMMAVNDPIMVDFVNKLAELEMKRDQVSQTTGDQNPLLLSLDTQIGATKASLADMVQIMKRNLIGTQRKLNATNHQMERLIRTVPRNERALVDITRQQVIKNDLYTYLLKKREETALSYASTVADSRTIAPPRSGTNPIKPVKATIFMLFGLFGLLLPIGVMAGRDALNDRVRRRADIEEMSQVPILAEIAASGNKDKNQVVMVANKRSVVAEQIRALRTNLQFLRNKPEDSQVVIFTSSISGEGKSFLSLNLGASLALVDRPTVILEMDLRKPKLHSVLRAPNTVGLSNYLISECTLDDVIQEVPGFDNFYIITSGPIPPNPAELLSGPRLAQLFQELRERFTHVIVDTPPIGLVTDAQLIAPHADATMFVIRTDHTPKGCLRDLDIIYKDQRFNRLNVVLNAVGQGHSYYYNYGYYEKS
ncbi:tyrosine-protein kinase family protein [Spirosoma sp. KNUC1025]|uniref:GumC family protein n=1 Tax=Spirosoma sp. KNUC1025 TaxID=2894082 RepID=UPI00386E9B6D|nr:polysaccharide biosynthesis tyrosine autokinase [Spirosoma sp. KNUC1025]